MYLSDLWGEITAELWEEAGCLQLGDSVAADKRILGLRAYVGPQSSSGNAAPSNGGNAFG